MKIRIGEDSLWVSAENQAEYYLLSSFLKKTTTPKLVVDEENDAKESLVFHLEFEK